MTIIETLALVSAVVIGAIGIGLLGLVYYRAKAGVVLNRLQTIFLFHFFTLFIDEWDLTFASSVTLP